MKRTGKDKDEVEKVKRQLSRYLDRIKNQERMSCERFWQGMVPLDAVGDVTTYGTWAANERAAEVTVDEKAKSKSISQRLWRARLKLIKRFGHKKAQPLIETLDAIVASVGNKEEAIWIMTLRRLEHESCIGAAKGSTRKTSRVSSKSSRRRAAIKHLRKAEKKGKTK